MELLPAASTNFMQMQTPEAGEHVHMPTSLQPVAPVPHLCIHGDQDTIYYKWASVKMT